MPKLALLLGLVGSAYASQERMSKMNRLQLENKSSLAIGIELVYDIFVPPPPPPPQPTKMKVFAAGLARSGTGSLAIALQELGYRPLHGPDTFTFFQSEISAFYAGRTSALDLIDAMEKQGFDVLGLDMFGYKFYAEAAALGAKVILTQHPRGGVDWAESYASFVPDYVYYMSQRPFSWMSGMRAVCTIFQDNFRYLVGGNGDPSDPRLKDPYAMSAGYTQHRAAVERAVPDDQLLVFTPADGWGPLCRFLEVVSCPSTDYPRQNDRQLMVAMTSVLVVVSWGWPILAFASLLPFYCCCRRVCRRRKTKVA